MNHSGWSGKRLGNSERYLEIRLNCGKNSRETHEFQNASFLLYHPHWPNPSNYTLKNPVTHPTLHNNLPLYYIEHLNHQVKIGYVKLLFISSRRFAPIEIEHTQYSTHEKFSIQIRIENRCVIAVSWSIKFNSVSWLLSSPHCTPNCFSFAPRDLCFKSAIGCFDSYSIQVFLSLLFSWPVCSFIELF